MVSILFIKMDREFHLHVKYIECPQILFYLYTFCVTEFFCKNRDVILVQKTQNTVTWSFLSLNCIVNDTLK